MMFKVIYYIYGGIKMEGITNALKIINTFVWGPPLLILLVGTGLYLTIRLKLIQVFKLPRAIRYIFQKESGEGDISSFASLCTALAATIGTGNIVGVATALKAGGPGALFWMWVAAFFGMATKYAEGLLAVKYRVVDENGQIAGGPMYYIQNGLGYKTLAKLFAFFGILVAYLGIGTFAQVNSITDATSQTFHLPVVPIGIVLTILVAFVTLGGIKSISRVAEVAVPFMAIFYIVGALIVIFSNVSLLPETIGIIVKSAFTPYAMVGGATGTIMISVMTAMRSGVARGVFSNESGLGSAPIVAAAAKTKSCVRQGLISMTGTFFDTIIVCSMTGIVIVMSGFLNGNLEGAALTNAAFNYGLPNIGMYIVTIGLIFFAFTTIIGWNYYGERCLVYLAGIKWITPYRIIFIILIGIGPFLKLEMIWVLADIVNALMAIPNLIGLLGLSGVIIAETRIFFKELEKESNK